jgi:prepilin-type N-terminal cleavage/methylation domain-containing protein
MQRTTRYAPEPRAGFTLIELLVVIAIIAVLVALTASATIRYISAQHSNNTEVTLKKADKALQRQVRAVIEEARNQAIPAGVQQMAGTTDRARVIWIKLRLKQAFPMTYREATMPYLNNDGSVNPYVSAADLTGRFTRVIGNRPGGKNDSAVCLLLALSRVKGGESFNPDNLSASEVQDVNSDGLKGLIDNWGTPLGFYRWPTGADLDLVVGSSKNTALKDPQDPSGTLIDANWNNAANYNNKQGVYWFGQICHPVYRLDANGKYLGPQALNLPPVIASAGPNKRLGLLPDMSIHPVDVDNPPGSADDNLYSYRLAHEGAKGD